MFSHLLLRILGNPLGVIFLLSPTVILANNTVDGCSITIDRVEVTDEQCPGADDGSITIEANCDLCADELEYSLDGIDFQGSGNFADLAPGTYTITVQERGGTTCSEEVDATVNPGIDTTAPVPNEAVTAGWQEAAKLLASNNNTSLGSISVSGDYAIVGAFAENAGNTSAGAAYIFRRDGTTWVEETRLVSPNPEFYGYFGHSVAIDGDYAIVGAYREDAGGVTGAGRAYIFHRSNGAWAQQATIAATGAREGLSFGYQVALSGEYALLGSIEELRGSAPATAYMFQRDGTSWSQVQTFTPPDGVNGEKFGASIALQNDYAIISAEEARIGNQYDAGAAYVYHLEGTWIQQSKLSASDGMEGDKFGTSVALDNGYTIIGARGADPDGQSSGAAYVFRLNEEEWTEQAKLTASDLQAGDSFGEAVAIRGDYAVVGAYWEDGGLENTGAAYAFRRSGTTWRETEKITLQENLEGDNFGSSVALEGENLFITTSTGLTHFQLRPTLPTVSLSFCGPSTSLTAPTAVDACVGPVTGSTTDPTTFSAAGRYVVNWSFDDGNGNVDTVEQEVVVNRPAISIEAVTASPSCNEDGTLTVTASCTDCTTRLEYSLNEGAYQSGNQFVGLSTGGYTLSVRDAGATSCTVTTTATVTDAIELPLINGGDAIGWTEETKVTSRDTMSNDYFAENIDIDGQYAIVGSSNSGPHYAPTGAARIYHRTGDGWVEQAELRASDGQTRDGFGAAVAIDGDYAVVGAPSEDSAGSEAGKVYVYHRSATGEWQEQAQLAPTDLAAADNFGRAVDIWGDYIVVGSAAVNENSNRRGAVYVFHRNEFTWIQEAKLNSQYLQETRSFGTEVAIHGRELIVSGIFRPRGATVSHGAVYAFHRDTDGSWNEEAKLEASNLEDSYYFGYSLDIHDGQAIVGMVSNDDVNTGAAYIFERSGEGIWRKQAELTSTGNPEVYNFGYDVAIRNGEALVGSPGESEVGYFSGVAYVYRQVGGAWVNTAKLQASDSRESDWFGLSVALSDRDALIGAYAYETDWDQMGSAYFFRAERALPTVVLQSCGEPVTAPTPTAGNACASTITGTTTDPVTFSSAGDYLINWTFDDGRGHLTTAAQEVNVIGSFLTLPIVETVESNSPSLSCWVSSGEWIPEADDDFAYSGNSSFMLRRGSGDLGQPERLLSPLFPAESGGTYALDFHYLANTPFSSQNLRVILIDASDNREVKQLFGDDRAAGSYRAAHLLYDVPATGTYRIAFESTSSVEEDGIRLDDISITPFTIPTEGGAALLTGSSDDACEIINGYGLNGYAWTRFVNSSGRLAVEIDANGNDLGDVAVEMTDYAEVPTAPFTGERNLSRHWNIIPEKSRGPFEANGGVKVRLYFTTQELTDFNAILDADRSWDDLVVAHYSDINEDCSLLNSTGTDWRIEVPTATVSFGSTAQYVEFYTTSFSEFGGYFGHRRTGLPD